MRPTLDEQLRGLRGILQGSVAPAVVGDYPQETLAGVIRALEMLEQRVALVGPFLAWDNAATFALLRDIAVRVPMAGLGDPAVIESGDLAALDAENERLRGLLAEVVPVLAADSSLADLHAATVAHLRARIARYPYTSTGTLPTR